MTAQTPAERKAAERQRNKEAGRVPVTVNVQPQFRPLVRAMESELQAVEPIRAAAKAAKQRTKGKQP